MASSRIIPCCIQYLKQLDVFPDDLFQSRANMTAVKRLCASIQTDGEVAFHTVESPNIVANALMYYLRELREPLLSFTLYDDIQKLGASIDGTDQRIAVEDLRQLLSQLSLEKGRNVTAVINLLRHICSNSENTLICRCLAKTFAPLLCKHQDSAFMSLRHAESIKSSSLVIEALIENYDAVFHSLSFQLGCPTRKDSDMRIINGLIQNTVRKVLYGTPSEPTNTSEASLDKLFPQAIEMTAWLLQNSQANCRNALDRRQMIKACRLVRNDLRAFESEYVRRYGRRPVTGERGNMQVVYDTYRVCKSRIRESAATKIQRSFRSARVKLKYMHSNSSIRKPVVGAVVVDNIQQLKDRKRLLKLRLREFNDAFAQENGRSPTTQEKEPLRLLYEEYHRLKADLTTKS